MSLPKLTLSDGPYVCEECTELHSYFDLEVEDKVYKDAVTVTLGQDTAGVAVSKELDWLVADDHKLEHYICVVAVFKSQEAMKEKA